MKKGIIIANFVLDEKFIDGAIAYNDNFSPTEVKHLYVFVTVQRFENFYLIKRFSDIVQLSPVEVVPFLNEHHVSAILLHSLYSMPLDILQQIPQNICVLWSSWGYDIYSMLGNILLIRKNLFQPLTKEALPNSPNDEIGQPSEAYMKAVERIDFISTVLPEEYVMIPQLPFFHANHLHYTYITPKEVEKYQNAKLSVPTGCDILIGNSGAPTNNHLDIFQKLSELNLGESRIYCPLSYAGYPIEYKNEVVCRGRKLFGERFIPLLEFMDKEEYFSLMLSCKYAIFGHIRQQALGNIREMLANGCKVFLDKESPMYLHFKSRGFIVYSLQDDITTNRFQAPMSQLDIQKNIQLLKLYTSPETYNMEMSHMSEAIRKHTNHKDKIVMKIILMLNKFGPSNILRKFANKMSL